MREVHCANHHPEMKVSRPALRKLIAHLDRWKKFTVPEGELSIVLVPVEEMIRIHQDYLKDPTLTDVITFDGDPMMEFAGEIVISPDQAKMQCAKFGNDFHTELTLYLVHGYLHLAGLDDRNDAQRDQMKAAERDAMAFLAPLGTAWCEVRRGAGPN